MTTSPPVARTSTGTRAVLLGGVGSGIAAYAFTILGARVLGEVDYAPVGVLWTIQYLVLTVGLLSLEALVTSQRRVGRGSLLWVGGLVGALTIGAGVAGPRLFGTASAVWPLAAGLIGLGFGLFVLARGMAAAAEDFLLYGTMTGGESVVRLLVAVVVLMASQTAEALSLTLPAGTLAMALLWFLRGQRVLPSSPTSTSAITPRPRTTPHTPTTPTTPGTPTTPTTPETPTTTPWQGRAASGMFLGQTTFANAVAQVLLAGGPLLTAAISAPAAITSQVFVTTSAARAPLVLVYSGLLARVLTATGQMSAAALRRRVVPVAIGVISVAGLGALVGAVLGPLLVGVAFGQGLRPSATFAALTAAAVILAGGVLTANQILIARRATAHLLLPWAVALVVGAMVAVLGDTAPDLRAGTATLAGLITAGVLLVPQILRVLTSQVDADQIGP